MTTCGMYDSAGEWVVEVGMPAKSGVAGGVLAVLPGQLGIAVFSPPLDPHGNSVRGIEVCREISTELDLNLLHVARSSRTAVRRSFTVADAPSRRRRPQGQCDLLEWVGHRAFVTVLSNQPSEPVALEAINVLVALKDRRGAPGLVILLIDPVASAKAKDKAVWGLQIIAGRSGPKDAAFWQELFPSPAYERFVGQEEFEEEFEEEEEDFEEEEAE